MKKIISLILSIMLIVSSFSTMVFATENNVTVYVTISKYGEILSDKDGNLIALSSIELTGKDTYTLDDVFKTVHSTLCEGGESAYETQTGDYGLYVYKFWEDTSGNFTYQVNFGQDDVWGPTHTVQNGDCIDFCINQSFYPDTEVYTRFDQSSPKITNGESLELILSQGEYTADGFSFSPCVDASITINGISTENVTDAEGKVSLSFNENGKYVISAVKTKIVDEETVTAIEAPVCVVTVTDAETPPTDIPSDENEDSSDIYHNAEEQIHNIINKYINDSIINDGNMHWFIADFADYIKTFPESSVCFTNTLKQNIVDKIIDLAESSSSQGDLAKAIITLRSLGYDAKNTYNKNGACFDIVAKLTSLITEESVSAPYYEYTLPYVLIALQQSDDYMTQELTDFLLNTAITIKTSWQDTTWGIDGAAPMLRALAPYCDTNDQIKAITEETAELIKEFQGNDGSMGNASSTGLAMAGLSSVGIDPETVVKDEKTLINGLMSQSNETFDGFLPDNNSFGTEQGLRGLIAWKLYCEDKLIYNFKDYPKNEARATLHIIHNPTGGGGGSSIGKTEIKEKEENKKPETTEEKIQGLIGKNEDIKIMPIISPKKTFEDIQDHEGKPAVEQLAIRGIINGKTEHRYCPDENMTRAEFATIIVKALGLPEKEGNTFNDISDEDWFNVYVNTAHLYGIVNGISESEFNPSGLITREEASTMIARAGKLCGMNTNINETETRNTLAEFTDYIQASDWAKSSLAFCFSEELLDKNVIEIIPQAQITRAEMAQILYNLLQRAKLI